MALRVIPILLFVCLTGFYLSSCLSGSDDTAGTNTGDANESGIQLAGRVVDNYDNPVPEVVAVLAKTGLRDTTDSNGEYLLLDSLFEGSSAQDTVLDTIYFYRDDQQVASANVVKWIDTLPDVRIVQRDIHGELTVTGFEASKVEAVIYRGSGNDAQLLIAELGYLPATGQFSGFVWFPPINASDTFTVFINVYDNENSFTGRSDTIRYPYNFGNFKIPTFDPTNALPSSTIEFDSTVSIHDTIRLNGNSVDNFGGDVVSFAWDVGGTGEFIEVTPNSDFTGMAPDTANSMFPCVLKVTDDDGNVVIDTVFVNVKKDPPQAMISVTPEDSIRIDSMFTLNSDESTPGEFGVIIKREWSIGSYEDFVESSGADTTLKAPSEAQNGFIVVLRITDDDSNAHLDTAVLTFYRDWEMVAEKSFLGENLECISFAMSQDVPYIAYGVSNRVGVMRFNGTSWEEVGIIPVSEDCAYSVELAISNDTPYVAYSDCSVNDKLTVQKFNGVYWEILGQKGISVSWVSDITLDFLNDTPYVAFVDQFHHIQDANVYVKRFNGTNWETVGDTAVPNAAYNVSLGMWDFWPPEPYQGLYVAYNDKANDSKLNVAFFADTAWVPTSSSGISDGTFSDVTLSMGDDSLSVAFIDDMKDGKLTVMSYTGNWRVVGEKGFTDAAVDRCTIVRSNYSIYAAYREKDNNGKLSVVRFNGQDWEKVGGEVYAYYGAAENMSLAVFNDILYIAYTNELDQVMVRNYYNISR